MGRKEASFGRVVKDLRRALKLTQTELARRVACATITIRKVEADGMHPSRQIVERLAMALDVSPQERPRFVQLARATALAEHSPVPIPTPTPAPEEIGLADLSGRAIRGYELGERLGTGGFGVVYRAMQPLVEREVAIKIVLPQYADHPDFIRRFEAEAQLVARLEHPYIVPLYDYWREPGVAYLVMRLLRGGSLEEKVRAGPLALETVAVLLEQIGAALHAAHRQGVVHRDLKPANVLLDEDGNGYLADFGIAKDLNVEERTQVGTIVASPAYASPEQIRSETVLPQADIYGLGVLLYELLAGEKPFPGPTPIDYIQQHLSSPLPSLAVQPGLDPLLRRATAKDPAERYPDVPSLLADFRQTLAGRPLRAVPYALAVPVEELKNPYKGLRAFTEADADDFFGRETLVQELLGSMATADDEEAERMGVSAELGRFLAVVGPSGCGKSSVVKAGLIPALRRGALPGSEQWFIVAMQPGAHPFEELEAALLRIAVNLPESLLAQLREGERGLLRAVRRVLPADPAVELVLVLDQFEELFTQVADEEERTAFIATLVTAVVDPQSRVRVVVTLRADFTDRPLQYVDLGELLRRRAVFVLPLMAEELEEAIVRPAARVGLALEEGLEAAIIQNMGEEPGMLPLLEYTLTELFERREGWLLTLAAYHEIGGVSGALARRAEELYRSLDAGEQEAARQLFLRLVTLGEGTEDTRRRVLRAEVEGLGQEAGSKKQDARSRMREVIGIFGRHRLLTFDRDPLTRGPAVEVAHEALLRVWGRLRDWLEESRGDVRLQRLLAAAAGEWEGVGREPSYLLQGARLAQFEGWAVGSRVALTEGEGRYLETSVAARAAEEEAEKARREQELATARQLAETEKARAAEQERRAEAERQRAEEQGRAAKRLRQRALWLAGALAVAAVLALAAVWFGRQATLSADSAQAEARSRATQQAVAEGEAQARATAEAEALASLNHSEALRLASEANRLLLKEGNPELIALLALRSLRYEYTPQGDEALEGAARLDYPARILTSQIGDALYPIAWSPDGRYIAAGSFGGILHLWDAASGKEIRQFTGHTVVAARVVFSPDSRFIASLDGEWTARVWDVRSGQEEVHRFATQGNSTVFSPDGRYLLTGGNQVTMWDTASGQAIRTFAGPTEAAGYVAFSPDGRTVAAVSDADKVVWLWDANTGELRKSFSVAAHTGSMMELLFFPDSQTLLTAGYEGTVRRWDIESGTELQHFEHSSGISGACIALSPDGGSLLVNTLDGISHLWDVASGVELLRFRDPAQAFGAAFAPDSRTVATASSDGHVRLWEVSPTGDLARFLTQDAMLTDIAFSPDGQTLATAGTDGAAHLWDTRSGAEIRVFTHTAEVWGLAFSPDGQTIATACNNGLVRLWDVGTGQELRQFTGDAGRSEAHDVAFSPDGQYLATLCNDATIHLWNMASGEQCLVMTQSVYGETMAFSPRGDTVLTGSYGGHAYLWDIATGELVHTLALGDEQSEMEGVAYSSDGRYVVAGSVDGTLCMWDAASGEEVRCFIGHGNMPYRTAFSPDGRYLLSGSTDETARLWEVATGQELRRFAGHADVVAGVAFSLDGRVVATASWDGTIRLWHSDINDTIAYLCGRLLRDLTAEEREQYGIGEGETCPLRVER